MKAWRVMMNTLKRGTDIHQDNIATEKEAKRICHVASKKFRDANFFVQEYEEARVGRNVLSATST